MWAASRPGRRALEVSSQRQVQLYFRLMMPEPATAILIALQIFVVSFVGLHNWIPLGSLNDLPAVRAEFPGSKLFFTTLSNLVPAAFGLFCSFRYFSRGFPEWLVWYLWIFYLLACCGSLYAWWIPYFFGMGGKRAAREQALYGKTHAFLPERNGLRPNTLHVIFDVVTLAVLATLAVVQAQMR
ncbi:MAG TPA: hypothetical protein VGD60_04960 [Candidatus Acidoferrales bacterium]